MIKNVNRCQVLEEFDKVQNDNNVVHNIATDIKSKDIIEKNNALNNENSKLKKKIQEMKINEELIEENYEIEKMTVESLEEHAKSLEKEHKIMHS